MARAVALCKGGPLDGMEFSVPLNDNGEPEPLHSREEVTGVLYVPDKKVKTWGALEFDSLEHEVAYEYVVQ